MYKEKKNRRFAAFKAYLMISLFALYFILITGIGIALLGLGLYAIIRCLKYMFSNVGTFVLGIIAIGGIVFIDYFIYMGLIHPIVVLVKTRREQSSKEITREKAPLLFHAIEDVVQSVGCKSPKHVYLNSEANASVSFDSSLLSLFYPIPKNLTIGLALLDGSNVSELKSILAHEFGHFSQKTMHAGTCAHAVENLYISYVQALSSLRYFIPTIILLANCYAIQLLYKVVQATCSDLKRQMEFDADEIAAATIGKEAFVSAFCKLKAQKYKQTCFENVLALLYDEDKTVEDKWACKSIWWALNAHSTVYDITPSKLITDFPQEIKSHITIIYIESTHPTDKARLDNVRKLEISSSPTIDYSPSIDLIPADVIKEYYEVDEQPCQTCMLTSEFKKWFESNTNYYSKRTIDYFSRSFTYVDTSLLPAATISSPFIDKNVKMLEEYEVALSDQDLLNQLIVKRMAYKAILYDNRQATIEEVKQLCAAKCDSLYHGANQIDVHIYLYLMQNSDDKDKSEIVRLYQHINAANSVIKQLKDIRDGVIECIKNKEDEKVDFGKYEKQFKELIHKEDIKTLVGHQNIQILQSYTTKSYNMITYTNWNKLNEFLGAVAQTMDIVAEAGQHCKASLSHIAAKLLPNSAGNHA